MGDRDLGVQNFWGAKGDLGAKRDLGVQKGLVDRKTTEEQMDMLGLKETIDQLATANGVRWYGHVLRRDNDSVLRVALNLEVTGKRKRGRPKKTWKKQVEEEAEKVGLKKEDALRRDKWRDGVREIAEGMG